MNCGKAFLLYDKRLVSQIGKRKKHPGRNVGNGLKYAIHFKRNIKSILNLQRHSASVNIRIRVNCLSNWPRFKQQNHWLYPRFITIWENKYAQMLKM